MHSIAVGSIFTECNHFGGVSADLETFRRSELFYGQDIVDLTTGTVGGMLHRLKNHSATIKPLLVASACPSGPVTRSCYDTLKNDLLQRLRDSLPVDGVLLALHGAAVVEGLGSLESDLLSSVRSLVTDRVPIVATLDLHAHVTESMVHHADALIAWETYPHKDSFETGVRGATAMLDILEGRLKPSMCLAKVPVLVSGVLGHTEGTGPFADVMRLAKSIEAYDGVYSTSAFLVHPYLDLPDMGGGGLVITNNDPSSAEELARQIADLYWQKRFDLEPSVYDPDEAIKRGTKIDGGPILLVETADCCGGGAAGDSVATLKALLEMAPDAVSLVLVVDAEAARRCYVAGLGAEISILIGHRHDPKWGEPIPVRGCVVKISDGNFVYRGGIWDGRIGQMGPSAVLLVGQIQIAIASFGTYEWFGEQFELMDLEPRRAKFVVVKNPMNYRMAYGSIAKSEFILDTPGPTPATLRKTPFENLVRPYYPADPDIVNLTPTVYRSIPR